MSKISFKFPGANELRLIMKCIMVLYDFKNTNLILLLTHMALEISVNIGSGNGLLPDGTKPLPKPMLIYHH